MRQGPKISVVGTLNSISFEMNKFGIENIYVTESLNFLFYEKHVF